MKLRIEHMFITFGTVRFWGRVREEPVQHDLAGLTLMCRHTQNDLWDHILQSALTDTELKGSFEINNFMHMFVLLLALLGMRSRSGGNFKRALSINLNLL